MKIIITGRQMNVRDSLKELTITKLERFEKFFDDDTEVYVSFSWRRNMQMVEITISTAGMMFRSEEGDETFQNAIDRAVDTLERQIRKNKTRLEKRMRNGAFRALPEYDEDIPEETEFQIKRKAFPIKPMSVEEAILQMNLTDHQFYVFVDADTDETCVVYKRKDGGYGLIAPEEEWEDTVRRVSGDSNFR